MALLRAFQEAVRPWSGRVLAGDRDGLAPALQRADAAFRLPDVSDLAYATHLLVLTRQHDVQLVVPTIDPELPVLAGAAPAFGAQGCRVLVSTPAFVALAADKWSTLRAAADGGFATVPTWRPEDLAAAALPERLVVKPRRGSASQGLLRIDRGVLDHALALVPEPLIQPSLDAPEITIDALFDFEGRALHYVPRRRIRTLAGESIQGVTLPDDALRPWLIALLDLLGKHGARGPVTLQAFLTPDGPWLSEVNARFGGGFPLAHAAGARYPEWIVHLTQGERLPAALGAYTPGLYLTRYHTDLIVPPLFADDPDGR